MIFTYVPAIALLFSGFALVLIGELLFATVAVVAPPVFTVFAKRINSRALWRNPLVRQPAEAVVGPAALRMSNPNATTEWNWQSFGRAVETQRSFVLLGRPFTGPGKRTQLFCYLPKGALPDPAEAAPPPRPPRPGPPGGVRAR